MPLSVTYLIGRVHLTEVYQYRRHGVVMDVSLCFRNHTDSTIDKPSKLICFVVKQINIVKDRNTSIYFPGDL